MNDMGIKVQIWQQVVWCRGYYVDTVAKNAKRIARYIQNQLREDQLSDQMTLREFENSFMGGR
mgnify:CR=1 FL=1